MVFCIYNISITNALFLFLKFKFILATIDFRSAANDDAPVLIAMIASIDAVFIHLDVTIPFVGF